MDSFPFNFTINYKMEIFKLKPPSNFTLLKEATCEKFDITICNIFYIEESGYEKEIKNDEDYINLINILTEEKYSEIELIVKTEKDISKHRKVSLRKRSSMRENNQISSVSMTNNHNDEEEDETNGELGMQNDYNYFGDTRNRKGMYDDGYTNQNKGFKEQKRIYYIKEKKNMQRMEQFGKEKEEEEEEDEKEEEREKKHKRKLKNKSEKNIDENNNYTEIIKPVKKKKNPKKERTKW